MKKYLMEESHIELCDDFSTLGSLFYIENFIICILFLNFGGMRMTGARTAFIAR